MAEANVTPALAAARGRRRGLQAALTELQDAVAAPSRGREAEWAGATARSVRKVQEALRHHVEVTEAPDGLHAEVLEQAPRLARRVEQLRTEHGLLMEAVDALAAALPDDGADAPAVDATRERVVQLVADMSRHRHAGAELVYEAYNVDISAVD